MPDTAWIKQKGITREGDLAQLSGVRHQFFLIKLQAGGVFHTHRGSINHDDFIGIPWGSCVHSNTDNPFYIFQPGISDLLMTTKRTTQILYPKDIGYIIFTMNIGSGKKVLEAGSGSGGLTQVLAYMVGDTGHVFSYEVKSEMQKLAEKNVRKIGLEQRVSFINQDIAEGIQEKDMDAVFFDLPNPYDYIDIAHNALTNGGFWGTLLPTTNQVERTLPKLRFGGFMLVDVVEIALRHYQPEADRFRPVDRMVAHTGYLIFARKAIRNSNINITE